MAKNNSITKNPLDQLNALIHNIHVIVDKLVPSSEAEIAEISAIRQNSASADKASVQVLRDLHTNGKDPAFDQKIEEDIMKIHNDNMEQDRDAFYTMERSRESSERQRLRVIELLKGFLLIKVISITDEDTRKKLFSIGGKLLGSKDSVLPQK